ncbi:MAG TPA: topoisomerase DNA-binding C4 zinc finger domain-containing protein [Thermodesulfobacteriota bacterium]
MSAHEGVPGRNRGICPECGGCLVIRVAKTGKHAGNKFWGCSNFPKCKVIQTYED